jgi:transposase
MDAVAAMARPFVIEISEPAQEGFRSYGAIVDWLEQECGLAMEYETVRQFVRHKLQAKLKVPRPRSLKQAPEAIATFKKTLALP